jgi:hypothetical protein
MTNPCSRVASHLLPYGTNIPQQATTIDAPQKIGTQRNCTCHRVRQKATTARNFRRQDSARDVADSRQVIRRVKKSTSSKSPHIEWCRLSGFPAANCTARLLEARVRLQPWRSAAQTSSMPTRRSWRRRQGVGSTLIYSLEPRPRQHGAGIQYVERRSTGGLCGASFRIRHRQVRSRGIVRPITAPPEKFSNRHQIGALCPLARHGGAGTTVALPPVR